MTEERWRGVMMMVAVVQILREAPDLGHGQWLGVVQVEETVRMVGQLDRESGRCSGSEDG